MTPAERQAILLIRRRKNHEAARKYADACKRRDTRAMHEAHKAWVRAKAELMEIEAGVNWRSIGEVAAQEAQRMRDVRGQRDSAGADRRDATGLD